MRQRVSSGRIFCCLCMEKRCSALVLQAAALDGSGPVLCGEAAEVGDGA